MIPATGASRHDVREALSVDPRPVRARSPLHRSRVQTALHVAALAVVLGLHGVAEAGIQSTSSAISVISAPQGTLNSNTIESDTAIFVWFEQRIVAPGSQSLDHVGTGRVSNGGAFGANRPSPGTVTPTLAESFVVHFDQAGTGNATVSSATITFDRAIIGVWHTTSGLYGSDTQWAPNGLTYGPNTATGLNARPYELGNGSTSDRYSISSDLRTITILNTYTTGSGVDQLRILVNPEPSSWALMGLGLAGLGGLVLRRRRRARPAAARSC